jgi:hypothetical protein
VARFCFVFALLLASCDSPQIGEVGPHACSNSEDDDHDGRKDCADPDCQNLDMCRRLIIELDGGISHQGHLPEGGVIGPPPQLDSGIISRPHMDSGTSKPPVDEDDSGMSIPIVDAGSKACDPKCTATEECIDGVCKAVTASASQTIAVHITHAEVEDTTLAPDENLTTCLEWECSIPFVCCPIEPYVRVVQIHDSKETVIGSTRVITTAATTAIPNRVRELNYGSSETWTVDLAEGDLLDFQLWDHNGEMPDRKIFECKPDLTTFDPAEQTCSADIGSVLTTITASLVPKN